MIVRKAEEKDLNQIEQIYSDIHTVEESEQVTIGWIRDVYPTRVTAEQSLKRSDLFVGLDDKGDIVGVAIINQQQVDVYYGGDWRYEAEDNEVMVLHTLVISPKHFGKGYGTEFVRFYEQYALEHNCSYLRMDTNEINQAARSLYKKLGYEERGILPCTFNGIKGVNLVLLEKYIREANMITFESDYTNGAHPVILQRFMETNDELLSTYGSDVYSERAKEKIKVACQCPEAQVHFLTGGTQTNSIVIATMLKDYEGVVSADTGHVSSHEAGAIEYTGHKVLTIGQELGKIKADELEKYLDNFFSDENHEHMVFPGMVYISHPTEYGTLYSKSELEKLSGICNKYQIPLYMDGARLGYGLMSYHTDVTLADIARYCDVFYIGGTKVGALCGEAVVFTKNNAPKHFMTMVKQHGALLAKGRLIGVQFDTLFTDDLYFKISRHAIDMAQELKKVLQEKGCRFFIDSPTNQQFVIIEDEKLNTLKDSLKVSFWEKYDEKHTVVRFATSWSTKLEDIEALRELL